MDGRRNSCYIFFLCYVFCVKQRVKVYKMDKRAFLYLQVFNIMKMNKFYISTKKSGVEDVHITPANTAFFWRVSIDLILRNKWNTIF